MGIDLSFFENIELETIRNRFYRKSEVDALLKEISARTELQNKENELLQLKYQNASRNLEQMGEAGENARNLAQGIIADANDMATEITTEARKKAEQTLAEAEEEKDRLMEETRERCKAIIREVENRKEAFIETMNDSWQSFFAPDRDTALGTEVPEDLGEKVGAIADVLEGFELEEDPE